MSGEKKSSDLVYAKMLAITNDFIKDPIAEPFTVPISSDAPFAEAYFEKIKKPMDLSTVKRNLSNNVYNTIDQWAADFNLVFDNAVSFNGEDDIISSYAMYLKTKFAKRKQELLNQNSRTVELKLIELRNKLASLMANPPESCGMTPTAQQQDLPNNEFSTGRIYKLYEKLNKNSENTDLIEEVKTIIGTDEQSSQADVNLSRIGKNKLVALEKLLEKQESN